MLERQTREYVEARIRAGLLEWGTVDLLNEAGVGARMMREGLVHDGVELAFDGHTHRIDLKGLTGQRVMVYGQTEIQKDLADARAASGGRIVWEAKDVAIHDFAGRRPRVNYTTATYGTRSTASSSPVAMATMVSRAQAFRRTDRAARTCLPVWLARHPRRHAAASPKSWSMRTTRAASRCAACAREPAAATTCSARSTTRSSSWSDERFWDELRVRLPESMRARLVTGPSIEKSIAPLRSFVAEPMRFGRLFLVGDAAHIVPPTGAKGLNLAAADVRVLFEALVEYYRAGRETLLDEYSARALARVWKATRFSWWFTTLMHTFSDDSFARKIQLAELDYIAGSPAAATAFAENYVGLGF